MSLIHVFYLSSLFEFYFLLLLSLTVKEEEWIQLHQSLCFVVSFYLTQNYADWVYLVSLLLVLVLPSKANFFLWQVQNFQTPFLDHSEVVQLSNELKDQIVFIDEITTSVPKSGSQQPQTRAFSHILGNYEQSVHAFQTIYAFQMYKNSSQSKSECLVACILNEHI